MQRQDRSQLRLALLWYLMGVAMLLLVSILSLMPAPDIGVSDKLAHFLVYSILSGWFSFLVINRLSLCWVATGLIAYGVIIEGLQGLTGYRYPELADVFANSLGVLLGVTVFFTPLHRLFRMMDVELARICLR